MRAFRRLLHRLFVTATSRYDEARLREELESHLDMQTAENIRAGMPASAARREAVIKLGSIEAAKGSYRDEQGLPALDDLVQDVRYAFRQLRLAPLFAMAATISLAMGIGANAAVFTVVERLLLLPLPVQKPHELVYVTDERILTQSSPRFSYPFYSVLRDSDALHGLAARWVDAFTVSIDGQIVRAAGELVSGNYFGVLGVDAVLGNSLSQHEDRIPGTQPLAVISESFWRRTFMSDPGVIGRSVLINDQPFTIVGVAANGFTGMDVGRRTDVWIPLSMQREVGRNLLTDATTNWLEIFGRLPAGSDPERTARELSGHMQRRASELPREAAERPLILLRAGEAATPAKREFRSAVLVLFALTGVALALACANVAGLAAVRSTSRHKEIAIRLALGIRRSRLRRQFLTEGLVLAGVAGLAAVLLAPLAAHTLVTAQGGALQIDTGLDARVLAFTAFVSLTAGCLVALPPMLASRGIKLLHTSEHSWTTSPIGSRRVPAHDVLVTLQIAMALSMLVTAALLVQSVQSLESIDPGFRADNVLLASLDPRARGFDANRIDGFWRATLEHVSRISGVESASLARTVPLGPGRQRQNWVNPGSGEKVNIDTNAVGPAYFRTLGITVLSGREFGHGDSHGSRPVVIVNERLAQMFWPQQDPIGKGIRLPDADKLVAEVIGVVRDVKYRDLRGEAGPMFYRPVLQTRSSDAMTLHVRTKNDPAALVSAIRLAIQNLDRNVPLFQITTLEERLDASFAQTRQAALLTGVFGVLALLLSGVGVYGVTALAVSRRTHDIGIRMALGARRRHIIRMIGARAGALIAVGLAVGLIGSLVFTRMFGTLLHGVGGNASTLLQMAALLGLLSLLASSIPVRAAIRVDAITAIRRE